MATSTFALVLVLTKRLGGVTRYLVAEFPSLQSCEAAGQDAASHIHIEGAQLTSQRLW